MYRCRSYRLVLLFFIAARTLSCFSLNMRPVGAQDGSSSPSLCRICKKQFDPLDNGPASCNYHKGRFSGAENSKHMGTKSGGKFTGLSTFWDCCDLETYEGKGCMFGKHISYDGQERASEMTSILINRR